MDDVGYTIYYLMQRQQIFVGTYVYTICGYTLFVGTYVYRVCRHHFLFHREISIQSYTRKSAQFIDKIKFTLTEEVEMTHPQNSSHQILQRYYPQVLQCSAPARKDTSIIASDYKNIIIYIVKWLYIRLRRSVLRYASNT